ncbi:MAG: hypothetical protein RIT28_4176, partial [Pseudomonadota bacterium]
FAHPELGWTSLAQACQGAAGSGGPHAAALADELALNLTKKISRDWRRIGQDAWAEFGVKGELSGAPALLNASIDRFLDAWRSGEARELLTSAERTRLYEHWKKLPILWGRALPDL